MIAFMRIGARDFSDDSKGIFRSDQLVIINRVDLPYFDLPAISGAALILSSSSCPSQNDTNDAHISSCLRDRVTIVSFIGYIQLETSITPIFALKKLSIARLVPNICYNHDMDF